ncbi:MAG: hypothetical protein DYH12_11465 [Sorangiineae bacterium PRO1]|nr:hypothetical protein [Sorangiineae bacterium PRO1]
MRKALRAGTICVVRSIFSYCIPVDDGAAPNPFWGVCSLAICKPKIRKNAALHDWVVGTGSKNSPIGDISRSVVYAMRVTKRVTMRDYDRIARTELPGKLPDWDNSDFRRRVGDSIYDFSTTPATIRRSVHNERNRDRDLGGEYVLLSTHFYYFGDQPVLLPPDLRGIIKQGQGHRRVRDADVIDRFVGWIESLDLVRGEPIGGPQCTDLEKRCILGEDEDD